MRLVIAYIMLLIPTLVNAGSQRPDYVTKNAKRFNLDPELLVAICSVESRCHPKAVNHNDGTKRQKQLGVTSKSYGMFQIKLTTARSLGFTASSKELLKPEINTYYASKLLYKLYKKYKTTVKVVSAYNAGKYVTKNKKYVNLVLQKYVSLKIDRRRHE